MPITPASVFEVASVSKQFTAMSILLLAERGKLSLEDEVRKYLRELPDYDTALTIRHLLNHTSGLRDVYLLRELAAPIEERGDRNETLVKLLAQQRALNFLPGSEYQYNNGGYVLLAAIVRRVSGQSLRVFTEKNIFGPLGMTQTRFNDDPSVVTPHRVTGYTRGAESWRAVLPENVQGAVGNAGVMSTAGDLLRWAHNFDQPLVGSRETLAQMQASTVLSGGVAVPYGLGLELWQHHGLKAVGHSGGATGFVAQVAFYPEPGLSVVVLCNTHEIDSGSLVRKAAEIYLAPAGPEDPANAPKSVVYAVLSAEQLKSKVGRYGDPASPATIQRVFLSSGKLVLDSGPKGDVWLSPISATRFLADGTDNEIEFVAGDIGHAQGMRVIAPGKSIALFRRLERFAPTLAGLGDLVGNYFNAEVDATYTVAVRDSSLLVRRTGRADMELEPVAQDFFKGLADFTFSRDAQQNVSGFTLSSGGVRAMRFDRVTK